MITGPRLLPRLLLMIAIAIAVAAGPARADVDPAKVRVIRPVAGQAVRAPRVKPRPNLSASMPAVLTPEERKVMLVHAAASAGLASPPDNAKPLTLSLGHLVDDPTDDELVIMSSALVWPKADAIVFADATQWPRLIIHPGGPGKAMLVDCAVHGPQKLDVSIIESAPGTREINHDERGQARAAASEVIEAQSGHVFILYQASPEATKETPTHIELVDHAGGPWMLFRCEINRLD